MRTHCLICPGVYGNVQWHSNFILTFMDIILNFPIKHGRSTIVDKGLKKSPGKAWTTRQPHVWINIDPQVRPGNYSTTVAPSKGTQFGRLFNHRSGDLVYVGVSL